MDVNNFGPFTSGVWGTVSDWTMVFVTALTARYIWRTLKSQTVVQSLQQKITDIEGLRHKYEIMPSFELDKEDSLIKVEDNYMDIVVNFKIVNIGKYEALNCSIRLEDGSIWKPIGGDRKNNVHKVLPKGYVMISLTAQIPRESFDGIYYEHYQSQFEVVILFDNLNNDRYSQKIVYSIENSNEKINVTSPEEYGF